MRKGFSLIETLIAVSIFALVISASMGTWMLFMHKSDRANTQASLDMDIRMVTERFRYDLRKTGRETILFFNESEQNVLGSYIGLMKVASLVLGKNQSIVNYLTLDSTYVTDNFVLQKQFKSPEFDAVGMSYEIKSH